MRQKCPAEPHFPNLSPIFSIVARKWPDSTQCCLSCLELCPNYFKISLNITEQFWKFWPHFLLSFLYFACGHQDIDYWEFFESTDFFVLYILLFLLVICFQQTRIQKMPYKLCSEKKGEKLEWQISFTRQLGLELASFHIAGIETLLGYTTWAKRKLSEILQNQMKKHSCLIQMDTWL